MCKTGVYIEVEVQTVLGNRIFVYISDYGFKENVYYGYHAILQLQYIIFVDYIHEICWNILLNIWSQLMDKRRALSWRSPDRH